MSLTREAHGKAREGRLTGSLVQRLMVGGPKVWNSIAHEMRHPKPFFGLDDAPGMPEPLRWGQEHEPQAAAQFWDRHPEYEMEDPRFLTYEVGDSPLFAQYLAYSPDRMLTRGGARFAGLETKCPFDGEVHVATVKAGIVPVWALWQCYHGMLVAGLSHWWFACWDPRCTEPAWRYFEKLIIVDARVMSTLRARLTQFLEGYTAGIDFTEVDTKSLAGRFRSMF